MESKLSLPKINPKVLEVGKMNITGNVFPNAWYQNILTPSGKAYLVAIVILSEILYWYRPTEVRNEHTGMTVGYRQKFKADMLQKKYSELAKKFGRGKREVTDAIIHLEKMGLIKRVFRTVHSCSNVMFIDIFPQEIQKISILSNEQLLENLKEAEDADFIDDLS